MDFGLSDDQSIFQESLRRWLSERLPLERVRVVLESEVGFDREVLTQLADQGVAGVMVPEEHGGAGLGLLDAAVAAEELGAAAAPVSFHSACVMAPLALASGGSDEDKRRWLPEIAGGRALVSFASADGSSAALDAGAGALRGSVAWVPDAQAADAFVVAVGSDVLLIPRDARGLSIEKLATVDDTRRVGELVFDGLKVDRSMRLDVGAVELDRILDAGRIALAADTLGACERGLDRAVAYAMERKQFERVIASFQAVKHMCAETAADIEPLRSLLWYAAFAWDERRDDAVTTAALLKALAGEVGTRATTTIVQVFGGMGFTWECDAHLWFKRAVYDRQMLGGPVQMRARAVDSML